MKKYSYSFDGENYFGIYDSRDKAIKEGIADAESTGPYGEKPTKIYTGEIFEPPITWEDMGENYVESMQENLVQYCEWAELFDGQVTNEDIEDLDKRLNAAVEGWIKERDIKPGFFNIEQGTVEEMEIPDAAAGGGRSMTAGELKAYCGFFRDDDPVQFLIASKDHKTFYPLEGGYELVEDGEINNPVIVLQVNKGEPMEKLTDDKMEV